jgi:hypothetical protein
VSLIDDTERLGHAVENGMDREEAVLELRGLLEQHWEGRCTADTRRTRAFLDEWRDVRRHCDAVRDIPSAALDLVLATVRIDAASLSSTTNGE